MQAFLLGFSLIIFKGCINRIQQTSSFLASKSNGEVVLVSPGVQSKLFPRGRRGRARSSSGASSEEPDCPLSKDHPPGLIFGVHSLGMLAQESGAAAAASRKPREGFGRLLGSRSL